MSDALDLIGAERQRQIDAEGYSPEHDAEHESDQLARAAACYALPGRSRPLIMGSVRRIPLYWPWGSLCWKPTPDDRLRELVKAGALIVAEIERLQRLSVPQDGQQ